MADIIDEEIELHLIDTRQLVEEAKKIRKAKQLQKDAKIAMKKLTTSTAPVSFIGTGKDVLPKGSTKAQTRQGAITGAKTSNAFKEIQEKQRKAEQKIKNVVKNQKKFTSEIKQLQKDITDKLGLATDLLQSTAGVGAAAGILSKFGPIGAMVAAILSAIIPVVQKQFERGGVFSLFLKDKVQTRTVTDEGEFNDIRSGTKYFTSDLRIAQKGPSSSNTQNITYETIRYTAQRLGQ